MRIMLPLARCAYLLPILWSGICLAQQENEQAWPDPLILASGAEVRDADAFERKRRPEIVNLFEEHVYGKTPTSKIPLQVVRTARDDHALHGLATRIQTTVTLGPSGERTWHILEYLPNGRTGTVPLFVGLNFDGNQTVANDPGIELNPVWVPDPSLKLLHLAKELMPHVLIKPDDKTRGSAAAQWQVEEIVSRGYGLATMYAGEIEPDFIGGIGYGIRPLFFAKTESLPAADDWGAIGAWAWGMSRIVDVLSKDPDVDSNRIIAFGFSRFAKTALWAAAQDPRFAAAISGESGQAGATLSHRKHGESIDHLMLAFPYWFCANYQRYLGKADELPVDGHLLLSLIAPRPLCVASAIDDPFSDAEGEFLSAKAVTRVYSLFGETGVTVQSMPALNQPTGDTVTYYVRTGGHDVTEYDWDQYLSFADRVLRTAVTESRK